MTSKVIGDIDAIMNSRSVAFFGVSSIGGKLGNVLMQGFIDIGFKKSKLFPINPKATEILGLKAYKSLKDVEEPVDLVIIALHPKFVLDVVKECVEKGVKGIIIFSAGFREKGLEGLNLERQLLKLIENSNTRIIGPNCMGIYSPSTKLSFFPGLPLEPGMVGFLSQSGSIANMFSYAGALNGFFLSRAISFGNAIDLDFNDFLEYLGDDSETKIISAYLEGLEDGERFIKLAKRISLTKPILIWKVGNTPGGMEAAQSHTGAICGSEQIWEGIYEQAGIIKVENMRDLIGNVLAFLGPYLPNGNKVAIISGPGGPAVSAADACEKIGLELAQISEDTASKIADLLPEFGTSVKNPIDISLTGSMNPDLYYQTVSILGQDENVDCFLIYVGTLQNVVVRGLIRAQATVKKPIAIVEGINALQSVIYGPIKELLAPIKANRYPEMLKRLYTAGISLHPDEQAAAKVLKNLVSYSKFLKNARMKA